MVKYDNTDRKLYTGILGHVIGLPSSPTTKLSSVTNYTYRGQFDMQNLAFMNMHEAGETSLLPMKSHVTIKYSSITMTS